MLVRPCGFVCWIFALAGIAWTPGVNGQAPEARVMKVSETRLRSMVTTAPAPVYPQASLAKTVSGVAVARVLFGVDGRVESITVLEAPDEPIAEAVRRALASWKITPTKVVGSDQEYKTQSTATFYFRIDAGKGRVVAPADLRPVQQAAGSSRSDMPAAPRRAESPAAQQSPGTQSFKHIDEGELTALQQSVQPLLLDVRDRESFKRSHRQGALNIPTEELTVRAPIELPSSRYIVIDCSQHQPAACRVSARLLAEAGFPQIALLFP